MDKQKLTGTTMELMEDLDSKRFEGLAIREVIILVELEDEEKTVLKTYCSTNIYYEKMGILVHALDAVRERKSDPD